MLFHMKKYSVLPSIPLGITLFTLNTIRAHGSDSEWLYFTDVRDVPSMTSRFPQYELGVQYYKGTTNGKSEVRATPFHQTSLNPHDWEQIQLFVEGLRQGPVSFKAHFPGAKAVMEYELDRTNDGRLVQICTKYYNKKTRKMEDATTSRVIRQVVVRIKVSKDFANAHKAQHYGREEHRVAKMLHTHWDRSAKRFAKKNKNNFNNPGRKQDMIIARETLGFITTKHADQEIRKVRRSVQRNSNSRHGASSAVQAPRHDARPPHAAGSRATENHGDFTVVSRAEPYTPICDEKSHRFGGDRQYASAPSCDDRRFGRSRRETSFESRDRRAQRSFSEERYNNRRESFSPRTGFSEDSGIVHQNVRDRVEGLASYSSEGPPPNLWGGDPNGSQSSSQGLSSDYESSPPHTESQHGGSHREHFENGSSNNQIQVGNVVQDFDDNHTKLVGQLKQWGLTDDDIASLGEKFPNGIPAGLLQAWEIQSTWSHDDPPLRDYHHDDRREEPIFAL